MERIAKYIARAGVCSRRQAEALIQEGRVTLNGEVLSTPATLVDDTSKITIDGKPIPRKEPSRIWMFYKPRGYITSNHDPEGRQTIFDILPESLPRVITIGRLDYNSEGLLLLTNDGEIARKYELSNLRRTYKARAYGKLDDGKLQELEKSVTIDGVTYAPAQIIHKSSNGDNHWLEITITEGKNREVRNLLNYAGLEVNRLIRISFGPFKLGNLAEGEILRLPKSAL